MPDFLKPYVEHERKMNEKHKLGPFKTVALVGTGIAGIVGLAALTQMFFPIALAGLVTFVGVLMIMGLMFKKIVPQTKLPPGLPPMTPEQASIACKHHNQLEKYKRNQKIKKLKNFFGIK